MNRIVIACLTMILLVLPLWPRTTSAAPVEQQAGCLFFTETGGGQGGYSVCDDTQARFLTAFQEWGLQKIGYPISQRYVRDGFVTQAFQKAILQWRPESGSVALVNIFDDLHADGFDDTLLRARQTPKPLPAGWDGNSTWSQTVARRQALLDGRPALRNAYFASSDPLTFFGLPTSTVQDMGNHYAIRLQRAVLQEWKQAVPWARAGEVTIANGGDIAKELGGLPTVALRPIAQAASPPPAAPAAVSRTTTSPGSPTGSTPVRLKIPRIGVDAAIESVGKTATGLMDNPRQVQNVAWYNLGARPGEVGNAVLSGHLDDYKSDPAVFWRLQELRPGDRVTVVSASGAEQHFEVVRTARYPFDRAPLNDIFGISFSSNLNLITCEGTWDQSTRNYSERLVVYTRLVGAGN